MTLCDVMDISEERFQTLLQFFLPCAQSFPVHPGSQLHIFGPVQFPLLEQLWVHIAMECVACEKIVN